MFIGHIEQLGLRIVAIDDVRCKLRTRAPTKSGGKGADCSYLHKDLLVQQGEEVTGGSLVFEGAVDNESQPVLLKEHSGWQIRFMYLFLSDWESHQKAKGQSYGPVDPMMGFHHASACEVNEINAEAPSTSSPEPGV